MTSAFLIQKKSSRYVIRRRGGKAWIRKRAKILKLKVLLLSFLRITLNNECKLFFSKLEIVELKLFETKLLTKNVNS
jgi:hypothetical protein